MQLLEDMRFYNVVASIFGQDGSTKSWTNNQLELRLRAPTKGWLKINIDASRRHDLKSISIGLIMRDDQANAIMAQGKRIRDCGTLVAESLAVHEAILKAIQRGFHRLLFRMTLGSLLILLKAKSVPKNIVNLIEEIRKFLILFRDSIIK